MATKKSNDNSGVFNVVGSLVRGVDPQSRRGSIINSAKSNIFEFPAFISSSVDVDYATATTSLLEQVYASYLQMAISANPVIDAETAKNGQQFADYKTDTNKYLEYTDTMYQHDACHAVYHNPECITEFNMISIDDTTAQYINEYCDHEPLSEFDHFFQEQEVDKRTHQPYDPEDYESKSTQKSSSNSSSYSDDDSDDADNKSTPTSTSTTRTDTPSKVQMDIMDAQLTELEEKIYKLQRESDAITDDEIRQKIQDELKKLRKEAELAEERLKDYKKDHKRGKVKDEKQIEKLRKEIKKIDEELKPENLKNKYDKLKYDAAKSKEDSELAKKKNRDYESDHEEDRKMSREKHAFDTKVHGPQMMDETKIQKLNTMKPLMMSVNMKLTNSKGEITGVTEYVAGVKVHARLVDADILPEVAEFPLKEMNKLTRKAKWRAGELKFFRDIVFRIKQKKQTAIDSRDPKRKWYRRLYELAHMKGDSPSTALAEGNSIPRAMVHQFVGKGNPNGVLPNASIIVSKGDVDNIKSQTGIDLLNNKTAANFCNELFLISFIVIDTDAQSVKLMLPDLHNDFEIHSMASINKQLATLDTSGDKTRELLKTLGR